MAQRNTDENGLTRASWIRLQVLLKPDIPLEEMQKMYGKTTFPIYNTGYFFISDPQNPDTMM